MQHIEDYLLFDNVVSFTKLKGTKAKIRALELGFSPSISLMKESYFVNPYEDDNYDFLWHFQDSEIDNHIFASLFTDTLGFMLNKPTSNWMKTGQNEYSIIK